MKKTTIFALVIFPAFIFIACPASAAEYVEGEVLVKFRTGISREAANAANSRVQAALIKKIGVNRKVHHVKLPRHIAVMDAVREYTKNPDVEYAQPNYIYRTALAPDDPGFSSQWGLNNTGQTVNGTAGSSDSDIDTPAAWDTTTGSSSVIIAVIDTGVKWHHEDLYANRWENTGETDCSVDSSGSITCTDALDNDGNGYFNDRVGWDFVNDDNNPADDCGHGTHVAGITAAVGNNATGVTGVMWTAKIMPLKVLGGADCSGTTSDLVSAISYAIDKSANIINLSLGTYATDTTLSSAVNSARTAGILVVAAAGNGGVDSIGDNNDATPYYPASYTYDNVISVAAGSQTDALASFSNYGAVSVDLTAPGVNVYSTVPTTAECPNDTDFLCSDSGYNFASGTSMSTPHVTGVAGLIWAANPGYTYTQVRNAILNNVNALTCLSGIMTAAGKLNAYQALTGLLSGPAEPASVSALRASTSEINVSWSDTAGETAYRIYRKLCSAACSSYALIATNSADTVTYADSGLSAGTCYKYKVRAYDGTDLSDDSPEASAETASASSSAASSGGGGGGGGGGCFIATAAYGSPLHPYVMALREFRDSRLLTNSLGRRFVGVYYKYSPPVAESIRNNKNLKTITQILLSPVIMFVIYPYRSLAAFILFNAAAAAVLRKIRRKINII